MNKMITSLIAFGTGIAAYNYAQKNDIKFSGRQMKKWQKKISKAMF